MKGNREHVPIPSERDVLSLHDIGARALSLFPDAQFTPTLSRGSP
jgi:hypothetical protein